MQTPIFLDYNSTTPLDGRVLQKMLPFLRDQFANASSNYWLANQPKEAIEEARRQVASLLNCDPTSIVFTSGATESINLGIKGYAVANQTRGSHIVTVATEHKAVLDTCRSLQSIGFEVTVLPVDHEGQLDLELMQRTLRDDTILLAAMYCNNETGVIHPLDRMVKIAHDRGVAVFTDATQAISKIPVDIEKIQVDLLALSAHKFYGPKGVGALMVRNRLETKLEPLIHGGGHQGGLRSGTFNTAGIVGMGEAARIASLEMASDNRRMIELRNKLERELLSFSTSKINGGASRIPNTTNICFLGLDANALISASKVIAVSNGSACTSAVFEPSHVLKAMGLNDDESLASLRFSLGKFTTEEQLEHAIQELQAEINLFRTVNN